MSSVRIAVLSFRTSSSEACSPGAGGIAVAKELLTELQLQSKVGLKN